MSVYFAYALAVMHVATGAMQQPNTGFTASLVYGSVGLVGLLHWAAFWRSRHAAVEAAAPLSSDAGTVTSGQGQIAAWIGVGPWQRIPNNGGITVGVGASERVAIFRYDQVKLAAVSNVCVHQNGPLGEGRVIDGCITCPWHGFQYRPEDGRAPAPFTEALATYELQLQGSELFLNPQPLPPGTAREVLDVDAEPQPGSDHE